MLVSQTKEIIKILLLRVHQHGRNDVWWKPAIRNSQDSYLHVPGHRTRTAQIRKWILNWSQAFGTGKKIHVHQNPVKPFLTREGLLHPVLNSCKHCKIATVQELSTQLNILFWTNVSVIYTPCSNYKLDGLKIILWTATHTCIVNIGKYQPMEKFITLSTLFTYNNFKTKKESAFIYLFYWPFIRPTLAWDRYISAHSFCFVSLCTKLLTNICWFKMFRNTSPSFKKFRNAYRRLVSLVGKAPV